MIVDIHAHVFARPTRRQPGHGTTFMSAEDQIALMDRKGVTCACILPLLNPETPAEHQSLGEILSLCERYPNRFIPFYNVDPRLPRRPETVETAHFLEILQPMKALGVKGIGEVTARLPFDEPRMLRFFAACEQVGFPIIFHTTTPNNDGYGLLDEMGFPRFERVLAQFPRLVFLGHSPAFWSEISGDVTPEQKNGYPKGPVRPGGRLLTLFRRYPNLAGDLSAGSGLNALERDLDHAADFIAEFQDRLYFGYDYCSVKNNMRHLEVLTGLRKAGRMTAEALEKILWKNANRLLGLGLTA